MALLAIKSQELHYNTMIQFLIIPHIGDVYGLIIPFIFVISCGDICINDQTPSWSYSLKHRSITIDGLSAEQNE